MEKEDNKVKDGLKIATIILALLLAGSLFYIYKISDEAKTTEVTLTSEKDQLLSDLEAIRAEYDIAINEKTVLSDELIAERQKIDELIAQVEQANGDVESLKRYKQEAINLRKEKNNLMAQNESLKKDNQKLTTQRDSTIVVLGDAIRKNDTLSKNNMMLNSTVEEGSRLVVVNLKTSTYKVKGSGKEVETDKGSRADRIKICYTIPENKIAKKQDKLYYIQVIDSKNNVLGDKKTINIEDKSLTYSAESKVKYSNKTINSCEAIDNKDGFEPGIYTINIFDGKTIVSSSSMTLR